MINAAQEVYAALFEPISIKKVHLKNRIVMAPMTREFAPGGIITSKAVDYYRRRAAGGVGLILTEGVTPNEIGAYSSNIPSMFGEAALNAWRPIVSAVHEEDGLIMAQLWHTGLGRRRLVSHFSEELSVGPCANYAPIPEGASEDGAYLRGREMTQTDIDATIDAYATAAANAQAIGFDGVEIHAAHGYLIDQFFWKKSNQRTDRYNGTISDRARLAVEVIQEIRRRTGPEFPIGLRFSQFKLPAFWEAKIAETPNELEQLLDPLANAGIDFFDCSTRRYWEPAFEGSPLNLAGWTKKLTGVTTMTVGSVGLSSPVVDSAVPAAATVSAESLGKLMVMFEKGEFDLVGVGRALLADPDWANKLKAGQIGSISEFTRKMLEELA